VETGSTQIPIAALVSQVPLTHVLPSVQPVTQRPSRHSAKTLGSHGSVASQVSSTGRVHARTPLGPAMQR
jgi:hypothetical protein